MKKQYQYILLCSIVIILFLLLSCNRHKELSLENTIIEIDAAAPKLLHKYHTNGAAIALVHDGEVVWVKGYGYSNTKEEIKVTPNTVFQVASISKPVTAWAVMKLIEEGKIMLDTPIEEYLNRWQLPATQFDSKGVTVRRVLSHTAGLSLSGFSGIHPDKKVPTLEESLSGNNSSNNTIVCVTKEPGTEFAYSGGGYMLLSLLLVTGALDEQFPLKGIISLDMEIEKYYNKIGVLSVYNFYIMPRAGHGYDAHTLNLIIDYLSVWFD